MEPTTILASLSIVLLGQVFKKIAKKFGIELGRIITLAIIFILSLIGALTYLALSGENTISLADWDTWLAIYAQAELWYTLVVKNVPLLQIKDKINSEPIIQ
jgi:hypothetical protein